MDSVLSIRNEQITNRILLALPKAEFKQILPKLRPTDLRLGRVLHRPGDRVRHVYFVNRGIASLVQVMRDGRSVEIGTTGIEGVTSPEALFGIDAAIFQSVVQVPGTALAIDRSSLRSAMEKSPLLNGLLQGYVHVAAHQIGQTAACNRLHSLDERCCRYLLVAHDSARSDTFQLTHEFLAMMLGVQRAGVTITAGVLQRLGLIRYTRGRVTIIDRAGLEASACECYEVIRDQFERLFSLRKPFGSGSAGDVPVFVEHCEAVVA